MRLHPSDPDTIRNTIDLHRGSQPPSSSAYLLVFLPPEKSVEGYKEGPIETGMEGVTARIRVSPHMVNAAEFHGLFKLMAARERMNMNDDQADKLDAVQAACEAQDGHNAWRDDQEALGLPDPKGTTRLIVVAWGGRSGFGASIRFLEEVRKAYPHALNISAACDCERRMKHEVWTRQAAQGGATMNLGILTRECQGAESMREIIDVILNHERALRA